MTTPTPLPGNVGRVGTVTATSGIGGVVAAGLIMLKEFGVPFTVDQVLAITTFVGLVVPFVIAALTSRQAMRAFLIGVGTDPAELPSSAPDPSTNPAPSASPLAERAEVPIKTAPPSPGRDTV